MAIWGFFGSLGSGKDTTLNYFLKIKAQKGKKIVSHVKLNIPYTYLSIDDIFNTAITNTEYFQDKILYISEFHLIMDSRRSSASVNVDFSQMLLIQLSKLDCDLMYSCQLLSSVDLRIKEMQKYFIFCNKKFRLNGLTQEIYDLIDWDRRIVKHPITQELIPFDIHLEIVEQDGEKLKNSSAVLPWETIQTLFGNFYTREIIKFDRKKYLK